MKWQRIVKTPATAAAKGVYSQWREQLAREAGYRCVYCAVPETQLGGGRSFHIEHYRPKALFPKLIHDYSNLFYACCICNVLKGDDWPREPSTRLDMPFYPSPAATDYNDLFDVNWASGRVQPRSIAATYAAVRLHLNRPQLLLERRQAALSARLELFYQWVQGIVRDNPGAVDPRLMGAVAGILARLGGMRENLLKTRPYVGTDLRAAPQQRPT